MDMEAAIRTMKRRLDSVLFIQEARGTQVKPIKGRTDNQISGHEVKRGHRRRKTETGSKAL